ncbi:GtrA family protein [Bradyrhizobium sp. ORS 86]|uniref:GtrA family protein n=1 Tax=Bradyrhizobium sp. ORS 86 TaxID=1685970 RepID=UPI00388E8E2F
MAVAVRYILFAIVSMLGNLGVQESVVYVTAPGTPLAVSMVSGTAAGFALKYILDKRWIFRDSYTSSASELKKIVLYGAFGVATTALFWATELTFWHVWHSETAKCVGAIIGLIVGYAAKYSLDKVFVFRKQDSYETRRLGTLPLS